MPTYRYVTSLDPRARVAHLGYPITACGKVFLGPHRPSVDMPADRHICRRCAHAAAGYGWITTDERDALLGRTARVREPRQGADQLVPFLIEGRTDRDAAQRLGVSMRTVNRMVADAMREIGARTRFQWGYLVGVAHRG